MNKTLLILICWLLGNVVTYPVEPAIVEPQFYWDFNELRQDNKVLSSGLIKSVLCVAQWSKDGGINGSGALLCGENKAGNGYCYSFPKLDYREATIEAAFKPTSPVMKQSVLFSYAEHSYGRGLFDIFLDGQGHVGADFTIKSPDAERVLRSVKILSKSHDFAVGQWYVVRVTMAADGMLKIYFNGCLEDAVEGGISFADFTGEIPPEYPVVRVGARVYDNVTLCPFTGLIDDVKIWNAVISPNFDMAAVNKESVAKVPEKTATTTRGPPICAKNGLFWQWLATRHEWRDALRRVRETFAISSDITAANKKKEDTKMLNSVKTTAAAVLLATGSVVTGLSADNESGGIAEAVIVSKAVPTPPVIDGKLDDACWGVAETTRKFTVLGSLSKEVTGLWLAADEKFVTNAATAQVCHDDKCLYVAFKAPAPVDVPSQAKITGHDGCVWSEDCVELFLDPMRRMGFYQILVSAIGTVADLESPPGSGTSNFAWEPQAIVKAQKEGGGFNVEMAIPFASLGDQSHTAGTAWGVNFTREGPSCGGLSTWAPVGNNFSCPERFGLLIFESRAAFHKQELAEMEGELAKYSAAKQQNLVKEARAMIDKTQARVEQDGDQNSNWTALQNAKEEIRGILRQIAMQGRAYILWQKDIWGPIAPDERISIKSAELKSIKVVAGQNTRAAAGFLISNLSPEPLMGRLLLMPATKEAPLPKETAMLDAQRISLRRAAFIELGNGLMIPDALLDLPPCNLVEIPARATVPIWLEIDTHGLAACQYMRQIQFLPSYSGFDPVVFEVNLEVLPVDLAAPKVPQFAYLSDPNRARFPYVANDLAKHGITTCYFMPGRERGYPKLDEKGDIVSMDYTTLDAIIANMTAAGLPRERLNIRIILGFNTTWDRNLMYDGHGQLTYGTAAWKKGFANALKAIRDHLFEKGFTYDRFYFYVYDESSGDPADTNSTAYIAIEGARCVKEVDTKFRTMSNPASDSKNAQWLSAYFKEFDILQPYRGHLDANPKAIKQFQDSGREICTYHILSKENSPTIYRNLAWQSARDGFTGSCAWWVYEGHSGDPFNSYDGGKRTADYGVVYGDWDAQKIIGSRRWEASYQGNQDYRAIAICRDLIAKLKRSGKDVSKYQETLDKAIADAVDKSGTVMDVSHEKFLRLAMEMQKILELK